MPAYIILDICRATGYTGPVIQSFRHKGLKALFEGRTFAKVMPRHIPKLLRILAALDEARQPAEMNLPSFRLHPLKGELKGHYAASVSGNWRVTFRFEGEDATELDYLDYH